MKVLTLRFGKQTHEIHMLNPGERFEGFGASRHPLIVGKTASIVERRHNEEAGTIEDIEMNIHDPGFWAWMARMLNGKGPDEAIAEKN